VERRPRARRTARARRVKPPPTPKPASTPWPNIEAFFEGGEGDISLGSIGYNPTLRHTAITWYLDNGVDIELVSQYCGVSVDTIRSTYRHETPRTFDRLLNVKLGGSAVSDTKRF